MSMRVVLRDPLRFYRDHRFTRRQASAYLDGELEQRDRERVDSHTELCPPCARFVSGLRRTLSALGRLHGMPAPDARISDRVLVRLRDEPHSGDIRGV